MIIVSFISRTIYAACTAIVPHMEVQQPIAKAISANNFAWMNAVE